MLEVISILRRIDSGAGEKVAAMNLRREGADLGAWAGRLDVEGVVVGGHSFGGTAAVCSSPMDGVKFERNTGLTQHRSYAFSRVRRRRLCLSRLASSSIRTFPVLYVDYTVAGTRLIQCNYRGKQSGPLNSDVSVPLLVVHSTSWSKTHSIFFGRPHFEVVRDIVTNLNKRGGKGWFMTARKSSLPSLTRLPANICKVGTSHPSPTDAPLIAPHLLSWTTGCSTDVHGALLQYAAVSHEFMEYVTAGHTGTLLSEPLMSEVYTHGAWTNSPDRHVKDEIARRWQTHVAPET